MWKQRLLSSWTYIKYGWLLLKVLFRCCLYSMGKTKLKCGIIPAMENPMTEASTPVIGPVYNVTNTIEVILLGMALGSSIKASLDDDGKINMADAPKFAPVAPLVMPAIKDIALVPKEITHLSEAGLLSIRDAVVANGAHIPGINEKWLKIASGSLKIGMGILEVMEGIKA